MYLEGLDNIKNIEYYSIADFTHHLHNNPVLKHITVKDYKKYFPNIKHFIKYGHLCLSSCSTQCKYCYICSKKIHKVFENKIKEKETKSNYIQACKI